MFSIIMPIWNRAEVIPRAVQSVLNQTFPDYELIIVDDGSEDNVKERLQQFLSEKVVYHKIPHGGVSAARNFGIKHSQYPIIAYLDSDNVWHHDYLSRMHSVFSQSGSITVAAYCRYNIYRRDKKNRLYLSGVGGKPFNFSELLDRNFIDLNSFVHSRDCLEYTGFHDESIKRLVDWEFILRIANKYKLVYLPEVLVDYYLDYCGNSITQKEDGVSACRHIKEVNRVYSGRAKIVHDMVNYTWKNIPDEKRHNWVQMQNKKLNTSSFTAWGYPFMLQVEPTNISNLSCPPCPTGRAELKRPPRHLKLEEFKSLIDDMERYLLFLVLWDWGEPLMNPELPAMIRYAAERDIKAVTITNGHFFKHEDYIAELLQSGLSTLIVAVDSVSADTCGVYRQERDLNEGFTGVEKLIELKKKVKSNTLINLRMVVMKQNEHEVDKTRRYARAIGADCFTVKTLNPSCGLTALDSELVPKNPKYRRFTYKKDTLERISVDRVCLRVWTMSNIFSNGDVVPCCYDYRADLKVGNILERPFTEIWNSQAYRELRKLIYNQKSSIPICRECYTNFQNSEYGMFAEFTQFKSRPEESFLDKCRYWFYSPQVRAVIKRIVRKH